MDSENTDNGHEGDARVDSTFAHAVGCADCHRSDSAALDVEPVDHMPIPVEAVNGFEDGVPRIKRHDRRSFIKNGALGTLAVYGASKIDWTQAFEAARAEAAVPGSVLVCLFLNGGADSLQLFPTIGADYGTLTAERPGIVRAQGPSTPGQVGTTVIPGSGNQLGFANVGVSGPGNNDQVVGFDTLWGAGDGGAGSDLAMWPAVNFFENSSRSHFDSRDYWFRGTTDDNTVTGWLGRWLDLYGSKENPLQAISLSSNLSKQIRTNSAPVSALSNLSGVDFQVGGAGDTNATDVMAAVAGVKADPRNEHLSHSRESYSRTVRVANALRALEGAPVNPGYPASSLSSRLQLAATLISAGLGTRIITIDWGSFDNHANILDRMDPQITTLSHALAAFKADLTVRGVETNVATMCFTEFGRRIGQNDNGTDHGTAGPMMMVGSRVRGGLAGEHPGISPAARVRRGDDMKATTDPRQVYGQVMSEWLGGDPATVMPGAPGPTPRPIFA